MWEGWRFCWCSKCFSISLSGLLRKHADFVWRVGRKRVGCLRSELSLWKKDAAWLCGNCITIISTHPGPCFIQLLLWLVILSAVRVISPESVRHTGMKEVEMVLVVEIETE